MNRMIEKGLAEKAVFEQKPEGAEEGFQLCRRAFQAEETVSIKGLR